MWSLRKYKHQIWGSYKLISYLWPTKAIISFIGHILTYLETIGLFCWFLFCFLKTKMITLILGPFTFLALFLLSVFFRNIQSINKNWIQIKSTVFPVTVASLCPFYSLYFKYSPLERLVCVFRTQFSYGYLLTICHDHIPFVNEANDH